MTDTPTPAEALAAAFERWRKERFGAYASYPLDAATAFSAGWKAHAAAAHKAALEAEERYTKLLEAARGLINRKEYSWDANSTPFDELRKALAAFEQQEEQP